MTNCTFVGNRASSGGGIYGGGTVTNCAFIGNNAMNHGGGIKGGGSWTGCTFTGNTAAVGGAIYRNGSTSNLINCIVWDNYAVFGPQISILGKASLSISYCLIQDGQAAVHDDNSSLNWGLGNTDYIPLLTPDGHLHSDSPCRNLGDPAFVVDVNASTDIDGEDRIMGGASGDGR